jgi:hypothetical protein
MALLQKAYLGATPLFRATSFFEDDVRTLLDDSSGVTVTASASAHTKGAWAELIASSSANASLVWVRVSNVVSNGNNTATLLDIGTGASGSEAALIENIAVGGAVATISQAGFVFAVPVQVPSGTRISARIQAVMTTPQTAVVQTKLYDTGDYAVAPSSVDTIGSDTATSAGTPMTAANTYVQVSASTSRAYRGFVLLPSVSGNNVGSFNVQFSLGRGPSGSEVTLDTKASNFLNSESVGIIEDPFITAPAASGSRLAIKIEGPTSNFGNYAACLIGIP